MSTRAKSQSVNVETLRRKHKPAELRVLFVGESPPAGGSFFYAANSKLFLAMAAAFADALGDRVPQGPAFLGFFKEAGCYLEDLCLEPVNHMEQPDKRRARRAGEAPLAARLKAGQAPAAVIAVAKCIEPNLARVLPQAGLAGVPFHCVSFPAMGHQHSFAAELVPFVRKLEKRGILRQPSI